MADNHDYIALDWVKGEIEQTLSQARTALEAFVDNGQDSTQITFCMNYIHQVHGTLQMVEFYGAGLLAEEMEKLCQAMLDQTVTSVEEAQQVLMESLLQLENYLEHIQTGQRDLPVILLPILNDIRALQSQPLLSDTSLFTPDLSVAASPPNPEHNKRMQDEQVVANLRKLRQMFQFSLAGIIRNQDLTNNFAYLYKVLARLEKFCQGSPLGKVWWVAVGFLDAIQEDKDGLGSATKQLLRELDLHIKRMIDEHETILSQELPADLLKNLLYYVAKTSVSSKRINELKQAFKLSDALPSEQEVDEERQKLQGPGKETMHSVVDALSDELNQVKDRLDLFVRDSSRDPQALQDLLPPLHQVANTIAILGLGVARKAVLELIEKVEKIGTGELNADDQVLMDMAGSMLYVEASLSSLTEDPRAGESEAGDEFVVPQEQFENAHNAVIFESRNGLEQAKNSIVSFIASQWDHSEVEDVPDLLDSIRGGLQIIPLPKAASLLEACSRYIRESILSTKAVPDWQQLDRLADAITSIEYYMERLSEGAKDNERILKVAEESVASLGYPTDGDAQPSETQDSPAISQHHTSEVAAESPDAVVKQSDEGLIDEEILEIFVEEAQEVMVEIHAAMRSLRDNYENMPALAELRRAFHTLKGSGRLVGASEIGELGWSVENLLNKYLDKSEYATPEVCDFIDMVMDSLPSLVDAFAQQQPVEGYQHLIDRAELLTERFVKGEHSTVEARPEKDEPLNDSAPQDAPSPVSNVVEESTELPVEAQSEAPAPAVPDEDDDDLIDDEILEIFIEEAEEVSDTINEYLPAFLAEYDNKEALGELRRAYHTLKGSGRMVGAEDIGETAWAIENMLNRVIDGSIEVNQDIADLVAYVAGEIPGLVEAFKTRGPISIDRAAIESRAQALSNGESVPAWQSPGEVAVPEVNTNSTSAAQSEETAPTSTTDTDEHAELDIDDALLEIFETEAAVHIGTVEAFVREVPTDGSVAINDALSRALHTLKGSANTAGIQPIAQIAVPTEKLVKEARANGIEVNAEFAALLAEAMRLIRSGVAQLRSTPLRDIEGSQAYLDNLHSLQQTLFKGLSDEQDEFKSAAPDPQLISIFLTEGLDILLDAEGILNEWGDDPVKGEKLGKLIGEVKTLHRGAKVAGLESIAELCECLEECYGSVEIGSAPPSEQFVSDIKRGHNALIDMMDQVAAGLSAVPDNKLLAKLREHITTQVPASEPDLTEKLDELEKELDGALSQLGSEENASIEDDAPQDDEDSLFDEELAGIFLEEAREIVDAIAPALKAIKAGDGKDHFSQLQRDLHTLKGGARLAGIEEIGDLAHVLEYCFEALAQEQKTASDALMGLFAEAEQTLQRDLAAVEHHQPLSSHEDLIAAIREADQAAVVGTAADTEQDESPVTEQEDTQPQSTSEVTPAPVEVETASSAVDLDPELVEIFLEEARDIIHNSGALMHQWESDTQNLELVGELQRELHTLKGGARMAEINAIGDLSHELETLFENIVERGFEASAELIDLCLRCHDALANMVDSVAEGSSAEHDHALLAAIKRGISGESVAAEPASTAPATKPATETVSPDTEQESGQIAAESLEGDLLPLFIDESKDILAAAAEYLEHWSEDLTSLDSVVELQREMHTLKGGARLADVDPIADLAAAAEDQLGKLIDGNIPAPQHLHECMVRAYQAMADMLESLIKGNTVAAEPTLVEALSAAGEQGTAAAPVAESEDDDLDLEVLEMFMEEANELIEALEEQTSRWSKEPRQTECNLELQRILHTLKGGARLASLTPLANESHDLETILLKAQNDNQAFEGDLKTSVMQAQDRLVKLVEDVHKRAGGKKPEAKPAQVSKPAPQQAAKQPAKAAPKLKKVEAPKSAAAQETIRVSAGMLEELVNLAGETSISRGRLEQQISDFGFTLEEMSATIERLREQLRRMEMETEAQVLFRAEQEGLTGSEYEDFDPLEMDRYSSIQQLSRSLTESTTDLLELRETLANRARDAETLLLQQSRINSELQESLMKTRMIPFSSMVPRLRRIVRQISGELSKQVDFDVHNAEGEMDRSVMERMVAPLEHMLRNALDHGIESTEDRRKAGKPEAGTIRLSLSREGGDVVLKMSDDGAGINDQRVLEKALSLGLVKQSAKPTRHEILQFIMMPGFSTAQKVTQISGRGVGMDVVASEIKQMGGAIAIDSVLGEGTEFTIRLPFTVSVNRALMVNTGEDFYAIPLNTIEGIVRVSPFELEEYYKPDAPLYEYAGRKYKLQYLSKLLHTGHHPKLQGQPLPLPVILVRGTDQPMALQVDSLMGSREIVVKSLGPQFGGVHGVSGATILGDGSVVVILDLPALIRDDSAGLLDMADPALATPVKDQDTTTVMVVDDSVTVRKVTSRLLTRNGMEVITAKDGVDAIAQLQDYKPDVMLLDIEMPRMDGFEVATLVRHDERLKDVPIIMITSRTGTKHRERALAIGVNEYLGKPFQEQDLLATIERLTS